MSDRFDDDSTDPAMAPLIEAGQGSSEGFEQAELELIEHASHGDEHSTQPILHDASHVDEEAGVTGDDGDADHFLSSEEGEDAGDDR
jgi:hypothetical protein